MKLIRITVLFSYLMSCFNTHQIEAEPVFILSIPAPLIELSSTLEGPKEIAKYLKENFKFKEDQDLFNTADYWQTPEEFLIRKQGDCEDYALFSEWMLKEKGLEAQVISFYGFDGFAHTVTVYKDGETFNVINEDRHYKYKAKSIEEALTRIHPFWTWGAVAKVRSHRGWMTKKIQNPAFVK